MMPDHSDRDRTSDDRDAAVRASSTDRTTDPEAQPTPVPVGMRRRTIARYPDYVSAQRAVDYLSDERFPVESVTIVGSGLRYEEQVTGRRGFGRAIGEAAAVGALLGALLGWFFGLFSLVDPLVSGLALALWGLVLGAIIGAIVGAAGHAATGGQRDFSSFRGYTADTYEILVDDDRADEAERLLERMPARR